MEKRVNIQATEPSAFKAMLGLEGYLSKIEISNTLKELIKIRCSQINNCAFCINMHTKDALKYGETNQRIFLISAWREASEMFTKEEQIVLEMAEEITLIHKEGLRKATYDAAIKLFSENQIAQIIMAIVTINGWNRVALSTHLQID